MWRIILFLRNSKYSFFFYLLCVLLLSACVDKTQEYVSDDKAKKLFVAKVGDAILYKEEVANVLRKETGKDSVALRERFVNNWIRKELLLQTAKMNLSEEELDIEDRVQDYRASLIINQYKQKYLTEHLDTLVTKEDVARYVSEYPDNFVLQEPIYRYYLAKVLNKNKSDVAFIRSLFSKKEVNLMQDFDLQNTTVIGSYDVDWYTVGEILKHLPVGMDRKDLKDLKAGKLFTTKDEEAVYLLRPLEIIDAGKMSPQEYIDDKVRKIILHNRKIALAKQLEYEIYEVAKEKSQFEVY